MNTKKLSLSILISCSLILNSNFAFAALDGGNSILASNLPSKDFSESTAGVGLSAGVRFNLVSDLFTDSEEVEFKKTKDSAKDLTRKNADHIFTEIAIFGNQFLSGEIKQNFGGKLNLGYETHGFRIYGSGGYVVSTTDYQEQNQPKQSVSEAAPFFGGGIGYDITKNISLRLDGMFYNFDFKPKNSAFQKVNVSVAAGTVGIGVYF